MSETEPTPGDHAKWRRSSTRSVVVTTYVTLRKDWPRELAGFVRMEYNARGHCVVDGHMSWRYFHDEAEAKKWCDSAHRITDQPVE
jgi:hypothetical protein